MRFRSWADGLKEKRIEGERSRNVPPIRLPQKRCTWGLRNRLSSLGLGESPGRYVRSDHDRIGRSGDPFFKSVLDDVAFAAATEGHQNEMIGGRVHLLGYPFAETLDRVSAAVEQEDAPLKALPVVLAASGHRAKTARVRNVVGHKPERGVGKRHEEKGENGKTDGEDDREARQMDTTAAETARRSRCLR